MSYTATACFPISRVFQFLNSQYLDITHDEYSNKFFIHFLTWKISGFLLEMKDYRSNFFPANTFLPLISLKIENRSNLN